MRHRSARLTLSAAVLATAALALTACSSNGSSHSSAASASSPSSGPVTTQPASPAGASADTGSASAAATATSAGPSTGSGGTASPASGSSLQAKSNSGASSIPACASSRLAVSQNDESVGAGQFYMRIVFTNTGSGSCTLTGYPGVSYVAANGVQSGPAAVRTGQRISTVTLPPHGTATAEVHDSNGQGGYSAGQCHLSSAQGLRIYPPNQRAALFLPLRREHCAGTGIHPLTIAPVQG